MTYPSQPQYAPQGYAPQQYQPTYQPAPQQPQYPGQPTYQPIPAGQPGPTQVQQAYYGQAAGTPQQGGQALPTSAPALGQTRGSGGGAVSPKARHLVGRTIIIEPIKVDETAVDRDDKTKSRPEAYFHLTVCDGGPLEYGDNQSRDPKEQHGMTARIDTPCRFTNVNDNGFGFVNEVRDALARGDLAAVGVFEQGTQGNRPYLVTKPGRDLDGKDRPDGDQRFALAGAIWQAVFEKSFRSPEPVPLVAPPAQAPPQVAYQPTAPAGYAPPAYPQPGSGQGGAYGPYATPYGAANPGHGPYGDGPPNGYQPQAYAAPAPVSAPAAPANPAFEAWLATLSPEQAQQQRAAFAAQQQAQPTGPGF